MLEEGTIAPDFTLEADGGGEVSLSDYRGKKVVLYFYPKDNTPGCTTEACNLWRPSTLRQGSGQARSGQAIVPLLR